MPGPQNKAGKEEGQMGLRMMTAALFALALTSGAAAQNPPAPPPALTGTRLDINAEGRVTRPPDYVEIDAGATTDSASASEAIGRNAMRMEAIRAALHRAGVADRDVRTSEISLAPQWRNAPGEDPVFRGYRAVNEIHVRLRDIAGAGPVLDALVAAGANRIQGPNLGIERADAALDEARTLAIANARARAELYARALGMRVKRVVAVNETSRGLPYANYGNSAAAGVVNFVDDTEIAPGVQAVVVSVSVQFELE
jgi:uncharacterized protein YggE